MPLINVANTQELSDAVDQLQVDFIAIDRFEFEDKDTQSVYIYYGFSKATTPVQWQIKRKTIASSVWTTATGSGDYATAWADRVNKSYT